MANPRAGWVAFDCEVLGWAVDWLMHVEWRNGRGGCGGVKEKEGRKERRTDIPLQNTTSYTVGRD